MKRISLLAVIACAVGLMAFTAAGDWTLPTTGTLKLTLQRFVGATGVNFLRVPDNQALALTVEDFENGGDLLLLTTTNSSEKFTIATAYTANTGMSSGATAGTGNQGTGLITKTYTQYTTVGSANDDATLPTAVVGLLAFVCNNAAANALDVFPASGAQINKESANTQITLAAGECMSCAAFSTTRWGCVIGSAN